MKRILLFFLLGCLAAAPVAAHRLTVEWQVADNTLVLAGRTDAEPAAGADVQLRSASGVPLASGTLDDTGTYRWPLGATDEITVVVNAGLGHRRTIVLSATDLRPTPARSPASPTGQSSVTNAQPAPTARGSDDGASPLAVRVVLGLTFLLAATAAGMSYGNARRLAELERRSNEHARRG